MKIEGLIPAVVQDYYSGRVLMLAYVNEQSYDEMKKTGETCFWSRSRNELWRKGQTSGNKQLIKSMAFDCDGDALLIEVEQTGAGACHTGAYSCFGEERGAFAISDIVSAQIRGRAQNPKENSYTNYLLTGGVDKISKKIGEEAAEIIIAAKNGGKEALTGEAADLWYHLLVLLYTQGVAPRDVRETLAARHQTEGNLKPKNKKGEF